MEKDKQEARRTRGTLKLNDAELAALQLIAAHRGTPNASVIRNLILEEAQRIIQNGK